MLDSKFLTQLLCFIIISISCLAVGFGSWLETNNMIYSSSPSVGRYLSVYKVIMVSSQTSTATNTVYLTFGLWRYCINDESTVKCSSTTLNFDIDALSAMNNAFAIADTTAQLPPTQSVSYIRLIPLLIATFAGVTSFGTSFFLLFDNQKKLFQRRALLEITSILCLFCAVLTSIAFGATLHQYSRNIKYSCSQLLSKNNRDINNSYMCQSYTPSAEIILLGLAVGLFMIGSLYCVYVITRDKRQLSISRTHYTNNSNFSFYSPEAEVNNQSTMDINEKQSGVDDGTVWNLTNKEKLSLRPPPPLINNQYSPLKHHSSKRSVTNKVNSNTAAVQPPSSSSLAAGTVAATTDINYTSSESLGELLPPNLPFANGSRSTYNHSNSRPLSYGSANTFGALHSDPNSPSADDTSVTSYMDYRNASISSQTNSQVMYKTNSTGNQSNHTLGAFPIYNNAKPNSQRYSNYNSSFEDEDSAQSSAGYSSNIAASNRSNSSIHHIPEHPDSPTNADLFKRINKYRQKH